MSFAKVLYDLPADRLREIVHRRAATLRGLPRITDKRALTTFLAEALSAPDSIAGAFDNTTRFEMHVLMNLVVDGGEVPLEQLIQAAGEANRERVERAVDALESNGLAFWIENVHGRGVWVPPAVRQHTPIPLPLRYRLSTILKTYDQARVGLLYTNLKLPKEAAPNHAARIQAIVCELSRPEAVKARAGALSEEARRILDFMLQKGGAATLIELAGQLDARRRNQLFTYGWSDRWWQGQPRNGVEELLGQGFLAMERQVGWGYGHIVIPGDVLEALVGRALLGDWSLREPDWETIPAAEFPAQSHTTLCRDIAFLFGFLGRTEAARTSKGTIHRNTLKALAKGLTVADPHYAGFVYALAREADLIGLRGRKELYDVSPQGAAWLNQSPEAQLGGLYDTWRAQTTWSEPFQDPLAEGRGYMGEDIRAYRDCALALLTELARERPGELASFQSLAGRASFRWWTRFTPVPPDGDVDEDGEPDDSDATLSSSVDLLRRMCAESLFWLGFTEIRRDSAGVATHVRLSAFGRQRLLGEPVGGEAIPAAETFVLQPNLEIYAPPNLAPRVLYRLFRVTEPAASGMLMLSREMLRRAMDRGETAGDLLKFLRKHSSSGVPQNVEYLIKEVGGRHGHIKVGQAGLYLQVSDPMILQELKAQKKLNIHVREQLADTVALITGDSVDAVLKQLRQAGYFPVAADGHDRHAERESAPVRRSAAPARSSRASGSEIDARIDWAAVRKSDGAVWEERAPRTEETPRVTSQSDIKSLVAHAIRDNACLEIRYQPDAYAPATERIIEPHGITGNLIHAYCRLREDERHFNIRHIRWARLTGEQAEDRE